MAAKGTRVTAKEKEKMWRLYEELQSYTLVAKKLRRNPDTVARYVREYAAAYTAATIALKSK